MFSDNWAFGSLLLPPWKQGIHAVSVSVGLPTPVSLTSAGDAGFHFSSVFIRPAVLVFKQQPLCLLPKDGMCLWYCTLLPIFIVIFKCTIVASSNGKITLNGWKMLIQLPRNEEHLNSEVCVCALVGFYQFTTVACIVYVCIQKSLLTFYISNHLNSSKH